MGLLRLLFALSVLSAHAGPIFESHLIGGKMAVQAFFMLSGFYMSLILTKKYIGKNSSYRLFLTNRLLRIFPTYWAILILSLFFSLVFFLQGTESKLFFYTHYPLQPLTLFYLLFSNSFILGMDFVMFLGLNTHGILFFTNNYLTTKPLLYDFLFVPQAWTLSLELLFYLIAPFLAKRKTWFLLGLVILSLLLRIFLYTHGLHREPWTNRFFPTELIFFLFGMLSYRIYARINLKRFTRFFPVLFLFLVLVTITYSFIPQSSYILFDVNQCVYFGLLFLSIPLIFILTKHDRVDRILGLLSYPFYIAHILVINVLEYLGFKGGSTFFIYETILVTMFLSIIFIVFIERPIDTYRQNKLVAKRKVVVSRGAES